MNDAGYDLFNPHAPIMPIGRQIFGGSPDATRADPDAAARAFQLVAGQLIGRARGGAEAAMHAFAQNRVGLVAVARAPDEIGEIGLHG